MKLEMAGYKLGNFNGECPIQWNRATSHCTSCIVHIFMREVCLLQSLGLAS